MSEDDNNWRSFHATQATNCYYIKPYTSTLNDTSIINKGDCNACWRGERRCFNRYSPQSFSHCHCVPRINQRFQISCNEKYIAFGTLECAWYRPTRWISLARPRFHRDQGGDGHTQLIRWSRCPSDAVIPSRPAQRSPLLLHQPCEEPQHLRQGDESLVRRPRARRAAISGDPVSPSDRKYYFSLGE